MSPCHRVLAWIYVLTRPRAWHSIFRMTRKAHEPGCKLLKYKGYRSMPWKNGRGVTLEIARQPATGEVFSWRLSLAQIDEDCDFSAYPGYRRALVLVTGNSLKLRFRGHGSCSLGPSRRGA